MTRLLVWSVLWFFAAVALAQPHSPDMERETTSPVADDENEPAAAMPGRMPLSHRSMNSARPSSEVATGAIEVRVVDADGRPVIGAETVLVVLDEGGTRGEKTERTDTAGKSFYSGLGIGNGHAYLVRVPYGGAQLRSPPFQLPPDSGYAVTIHRLETTRDDSAIRLSEGQLSIWMADERLEIGQTVQLQNASQKIYVFPEHGLTVHLPKDFFGFETSVSMGDQRVAEIPGQGLRITGSLMPGTTMLAWKFNLPLSNSENKFSLQIPWKVEAFRVIADRGSGMTLGVAQMPAPTVIEERGQAFWATEIEIGPNDAPLREIAVTLGHVSGNNSFRWIALFISLGIALVGVVAASRKPTLATYDPKAVAERKEHLLDRAVTFHSRWEKGRLGRRRYQRAIAVVVNELTNLLYQSKRE
jgi:hypothetical protein